MTAIRFRQRVLMGKRKSFANIHENIKGSVWATDNFDASLSWQGVKWVRKSWPGKMMFMGLLDADAKLRLISAQMLPWWTVTAAVSSTATPHRGGPATASDVHGRLIGRTYPYGHAAMGGVGVSNTLSLIAGEMR